jgi:arylsulfatase A-like enzyme
VKAGTLAIRDRLTPEELEYVELLYEGCVRYVDTQMALLFAELEKRGLYDRSLIVVTSDHGEEFAEHGLLAHSQEGYDEIARIPLLIKLPADLGVRGRRIPHPASMIDLMPTILELVDLDAGPQAQGRSLAPAIWSDAPPRPDNNFRNVLRTPRYKLLADEKKLYDLLEDPGEQVDLYRARPDLVERLEAQLALHKEADREHRLRYSGTSVEAEIGREQRQELEALGYVSEK